MLRCSYLLETYTIVFQSEMLAISACAIHIKSIDKPGNMLMQLSLPAQL